MHGEDTREGEIVNNTRVYCRRSRALFAKRRIRTVGGRGTNPFGSCACPREKLKLAIADFST